MEHAYGKSEFLKMITCNDTSKIYLPTNLQPIILWHCCFNKAFLTGKQRGYDAITKQ